MVCTRPRDWFPARRGEAGARRRPGYMGPDGGAELYGWWYCAPLLPPPPPPPPACCAWFMRAKKLSHEPACADVSTRCAAEQEEGPRTPVEDRRGHALEEARVGHRELLERVRALRRVEQVHDLDVARRDRHVRLAAAGVPAVHRRVHVRVVRAERRVAHHLLLLGVLVLGVLLLLLLLHLRGVCGPSDRVGALSSIRRRRVRLTFSVLLADDRALGQVLVDRLARRVARDEHAAAGARRVLAEREPAERLLHLHAARRVQRRRLRVQRVQRRLVQERDDLRGLCGRGGSARGARRRDSAGGGRGRAFRRADMWSDEIAASQRRMQSRSFFSLFCASTSCRRAKVWYCAGRGH